MKKMCIWMLTLTMMLSMAVIPVYAEASVLGTPTDLVWEGMNAKWAEVENAAEYEVQLYADKTAVGNARIASVNGYDFSDLIHSTAAYTFSVTAVGDGENYTNSPAALSGELDYVKKGDIKFQSGRKNDYVTAPDIKDTVVRTSIGQHYATNGGDWSMYLGLGSGEQFRGLFKIDVSALKGKVNLLDATLKLQLYAAAAQDMILDVYEITDTDGDWTANASGDIAVNCASSAQRKRHGNTTKTVYVKAADDSGGLIEVNTNHKNFEAYLKDKENWNLYKEAAGTNALAWSDNDGIDWTGGFMLGNPGGGSYGAMPVDSVAVEKGSMKPLEITIPRTLLTKWVNGENNGVLIRAREDIASAGVRVYAANTNGTYQPAGASTMPALIVHTTDSASKGVYLSYEVSENGDGTSTVSAMVYNCESQDITPAVAAVVYDSVGAMKYVDVQSDKTIAKMTGSQDYELEFSAEETDIVKIMLFNSLEQLKPFTSVRVLGEEEIVSTNASLNYNPSVNETAAGRWSYYDCFGSTTTQIKMNALLKSDGTATNEGGVWYVDYKGKPATWKINQNSLISDGGRNMGLVYTIGEDMVGKTITIEGTYTAGTNAKKLYICRSGDIDATKVNTYPEILQEINGKNTVGTPFRLVITPDKAIYGSDIIFSGASTCSISDYTISAR